MELPSSLYPTASGVKLSYTILGNVRENRIGDLVFFNSLFTGIKSWVKQYRHPFFVTNYRMIFFDYRCQGKSSSVETPFEFSIVIQEIIDFLTSSNLKKPIFIGNSMGGIISILISYQVLINKIFSIKPEGIVLVNTGLEIPLYFRMIFNEIVKYFSGQSWVGYFKNGTAVPTSPHSIFKFILPLFYGKTYLKQINGFENVILRQYEAYNSNPKAVAKLLSAILSRQSSQEKLQSTISQILYPVQIIAGSEDIIFPLSQSHELKKLLPNSSLYVFEQTGHSVTVEEHKKFNRIVEEFLHNILEDKN